MADLSEQGADRGIAQIRREIRGAVRGLWSGALSWEDSWESVDSTIERLWRKAFHDGAKEVGVLPVELTPSEKLELRQGIAQETSYIAGLLDATEAGSRANGGKLGPLYKRVELWVQRYQQVYTDGMMTAREDPKLKWIQTALEGCVTCVRLAGKIKRKSQWEKAGVYPQSPTQLQCMIDAHGPTVCKCYFEVTTEPLSKGPLPRTP